MNSLCEEIITIRGEGKNLRQNAIYHFKKTVLFLFIALPHSRSEHQSGPRETQYAVSFKNFISFASGVPLLLDLYEGCQKSFDLGPVKIGKKIVREIEVMNHSKVSIDASFIFEDMYPKIDPATDISSLGSSICLHPDTPHIPTDHVSR